MFDNDDAAAIYIERAEMHEQLAAATADEPARKMHLAMAAEYRRKAQAMQPQDMPVMRDESSMLVADAVY